MLAGMPKSEKTGSLDSNDTQVESPLVVGHLKKSIEKIEEASRAYKLPVKTKITIPASEKNFWVNLIGRGYPPQPEALGVHRAVESGPAASFIEEKIDTTALLYCYSEFVVLRAVTEHGLSKNTKRGAFK